jgi:sugar phosphate isomerase/epimerase
MGAAGAAGLLAGGLGALGAVEAPVEQAPPTRKPIPVALQLYSVRNECDKDKGKNLTKVIEAVAKMGYEAVEFAGYYRWGPKDLRKLLDDNGLKCCGTHTGLGALMGGSFEKTVELHKTLGCKFIIVPGMPGQYTKSAEGWKEAAKVFNEIAAKLKPLGMHTGYHNHSSEFRKMDGTTPWDIFFGNTVKEVVMQLDTGNCMGGGGDPVAIMKKYPGRQLTLHMKEHGGGPKTVVGEGTCPWKDLIRLARTTGGTQWFVIEHERGGQPPLEAVAKCLVNLRKILAEVT